MVRACQASITKQDSGRYLQRKHEPELQLEKNLPKYSENVTLFMGCLMIEWRPEGTAELASKEN